MTDSKDITLCTLPLYIWAVVTFLWRQRRPRPRSTSQVYPY